MELRPTGRDHVLVLCTANRCRSPLAGAFLAREAVRRGVSLEVVTAGFREAGLPATAPTVEVARAFDLDLTTHASRTVQRELLAGADLVIGMERAHVREVVVLEPSVWPRAFTLRELVRRAEAAPKRPAGVPLRPWLEELGAARARSELLGVSRDDDVADPTTDLTVDHLTMAVTLDDLVRRLVRCLWPA